MKHAQDDYKFNAENALQIIIIKKTTKTKTTAQRINRCYKSYYMPLANYLPKKERELLFNDSMGE